MEKDIEWIRIKESNDINLEYSLVYFDIETLGRDIVNSMIQIGSIINDNDFCEFIKPINMLDTKQDVKDALKYNKIDKEDYENAKPFEMILKKFLKEIK